MDCLMYSIVVGVIYSIVRTLVAVYSSGEHVVDQVLQRAYDDPYQ